ncbi:hypothetical protein BGZ97_004181, partial [Linnemannia gamsii]
TLPTTSFVLDLLDPSRSWNTQALSITSSIYRLVLVCILFFMSPSYANMSLATQTSSSCKTLQTMIKNPSSPTRQPTTKENTKWRKSSNIARMMMAPSVSVSSGSDTRIPPTPGRQPRIWSTPRTFSISICPTITSPLKKNA